MNQTIKDIYNRKSTRAFSEETISENEKRIILESAIQAPTAGNMALYSIIEVQDQKLKEEVAKRCDNQLFIAKAPLVLIFLADYQKWYDMFEESCQDVPTLEESDLILAMNDALIAAQNGVVAAESMGIGSCYIGDILENFEENQKLLHLPKYVVPCTMLVFGKPTQQQKNRQKPKRFEVEDMLHIDNYKHKSIEETKEMFERQSLKTEKELEAYIQRFAQRKFYAEFRDEMNRSVKALIHSWVQ